MDKEIEVGGMRGVFRTLVIDHKGGRYVFFLSRNELLLLRGLNLVEMKNRRRRRNEEISQEVNRQLINESRVRGLDGTEETNSRSGKRREGDWCIMVKKGRSQLE